MRFIIRNIETTDWSDEYFALLSQLTLAPQITQIDFIDWIKNLNTNHQVLIMIDTSINKIIGSGTIYIENKLIHNKGKVAHIEDIVTHNLYRGQGLGKELIDKLVKIANDKSCYKVILDCIEDKKGFYSKCGFDFKGIQMAKYF